MKKQSRKSNDTDTQLVYSTELGGKVKEAPVENTPRGDGIIRIQRETKGRKGKGVTLITGIALPDKELKLLAKQLKAKCGTGGTVKDSIIEIQGDQRDLLFTELNKLKDKYGWTVKKAGG